MAATTFPVWLAGQRITASALTSMLPLTITKPADESVTSSATLQNDNDLLATVVANASYIFDCYLNYEGGTLAGSDLKWEWSVPSGTMRYSAIYEQPAGTLIIQLTNPGSAPVSAATNAATNLRAATMYGTLVVGATGGTMQLQWAQNTINATPTIVHAGSYLRIQRTA